MIANIILAAPLIWGAYKGMRKGLIVELASVLAIILGVYACSRFSDLIADFMGAHFHNRISALYLSVGSVIIVFLAVLVLVFFIAKGIEKLAKTLLLGTVNRILGALFGLFKWALLVSVLLYFFDILNQKVGLVQPTTLNQCWMYVHLLPLAPAVMPALLKSKARLLI